MGKIIIRHEETDKKKNLYGVFKDVFPEKWFDDERIQACYFHENFAQYERRLKETADKNTPPPSYTDWQKLPSVFWEIPVDTFIKDALSDKYGKSGVDIIKSLFSHIDSQYTDEQIKKTYNLSKQEMKTRVISQLVKELIKQPPSKEFSSACFSHEVHLSKYIDFETPHAVWSSLYERVDEDVKTKLKTNFNIKLEADDDLLKIKNKLQKLFVDYYVNFPMGFFGAVAGQVFGKPQRKHREEAYQLIHVIANCENPYQLKNILFCALNKYEYDAYREYEKNAIHFPGEHLTIAGIRENFHFKNSYYQRLLTSFKLVDTFMHPQKDNEVRLNKKNK